MVSAPLVSSRIHHGDHQGTKRGERVYPLHRNRAQPSRHDGSAPGKSDLYASLCRSEPGQLP